MEMLIMVSKEQSAFAISRIGTGGKTFDAVRDSVRSYEPPLISIIV